MKRIYCGGAKFFCSSIRGAIVSLLSFTALVMCAKHVVMCAMMVMGVWLWSTLLVHPVKHEDARIVCKKLCDAEGLLHPLSQ